MKSKAQFSHSTTLTKSNTQSNQSVAPIKTETALRQSTAIKSTSQSKLHVEHTIPAILKTAAEKYGNDDYIFEKQNGTFVPRSFAQFCDDVKTVASSLQATHQPDDIIVICGENSYNYAVADVAIMGFVGVSAVLSKEWNIYDLGNALKLLQPKTFFYGPSKAEVVAELREQFPQVNFLPLANLLDGSNANTEPTHPELAQQKSASSDRSEPVDPHQGLDEHRISPERPCKIVFTSGTTSMPKAVLLSQKGMFSCYEDLERRAPLSHTDRDYLFLPLSHTYAGIWNLLISLINGMSIYLCSDTKQIFAELAEVKPTVFCAVPLIFERLYAACQASGQKPQDLLGGEIKYLFCGGAYFQPEIRQFLKSNGLNLLEAYGLTETSSMISVEYPDSNDFTSAGVLMESLTAKIDQPNSEGIGELLIKGANIFQEYYHNPEATKLAKTDDGYFRTGDLGKIVKLLPDGTDGEVCYQTVDLSSLDAASANDNSSETKTTSDNIAAGTKYKIYLQGRKKRVILFANGENIYPEDIEKLFTDDNITKVKVFQKDQQVFAQIFVKAQTDGQAYIDAVNTKLPKYSQIRGYEVVVDSYDTRLK